MAKKEDKETDSIDKKKILKDINKELETKKEEIIEEISNRIEDIIELSVNKRMKEEEKKFVRGKNIKILNRDILIIILVSIAGYFGYCLYEIDYFNIKANKINEKYNKDKQTENKIKNDDTYNNDYYINKYSYLVDAMQINDESVFELYYKDKITKDNISEDLKLKIAYHTLEDKYKTIDIDNNTITVNKNDLTTSFHNIFESDVAFKNKTFTYNNTRFIYHKDTYLAFNEEWIECGLLYKIYDAKIENDALVFEVVIAKLNTDNKLLTDKNELVVEHYNQEDILNYKNILPKYKYTFLNKNNKYFFQSIERL